MGAGTYADEQRFKKKKSHLLLLGMHEGGGVGVGESMLFKQMKQNGKRRNVRQTKIVLKMYMLHI